LVQKDLRSSGRGELVSSRKVRAPMGGLPGNAWACCHQQHDGKCHRKHTADDLEGSGKGEKVR
jgi:hypothetical protein